MAKSKTEGNISALNYLYKELNWLVNKIETSSRGKISKRDLLIYVLVGIFIISVYFGGILGGFTFVLVLVTLWNTRITQGLLKQSRETFEQSKIGFLVDMIDRTIEHVEKLPEHEFPKQARYIMSKARTNEKINKKIGLEFRQAMMNWTTARGKLQREIEKLMKKP